MRTPTSPFLASCFVLFSLLFSAAAAAENKPVHEVIHETNSPFNPFVDGHYIYGWDVYEGHSVAMQFIPKEDYWLSSISVWLMNNASRHRANLTLSVCESRQFEQSTFVPDESKCLSSWEFQTPPLPIFVPSLITIPIDFQEKQIPVNKGEHYWIVIASDDKAIPNGVWTAAADDKGIMAYSDNGEWWPTEGSTTAGSTQGVRRNNAPF